MSHLRAGILLVLFFCLSACGRQVVEFGADAVRPRVIATQPQDTATGVGVDAVVRATFNQAMDAATLNAATFTLTQAGTSVAGSVTLDAPSNTATFRPTVALSQNLFYTARLSMGAKSSTGLALAVDYVWSFTTADTVSVEALTVTDVTPLDHAVDVPTDSALTATFSQAMNATTITPLTFVVEQDGTPVTGAVTLDAATNIATFTPDAPLGDGLVYTATITTGAKDSAGLALATDYSWTFTVTDSSSDVAPTVVATLPLDGATDVAPSSAVSAKFSEAIAAATIDTTTFTLKQGSTAVPGKVTFDAATRTATLTPTAALRASKVYTATITTAVTDLAGLGLRVDYVWSFTTADSVSPPTVTATDPAALANNVPLASTISATFSQAIDPTTLTTTTFVVKQGLTSVVGLVTFDGATNTVTFTPTSPLAPGLVYTATISTGVKDVGGTALATAFTWTFTTSACGQAPIVLGAASSFVVLAGSTVTNTGLTAILGDLGVSPGTAITGFPPGTIVGTIHAGDPTAAQGIADLTTAYNDAAGRTLCPVTVSGNLGGQTLTPGLYKSTTSLAVSSGDLTLDAQGDGNAIFVFQMASTLTTTAGRLVILTNGAKSANIYWQVGTSATLGTTSVFQGTIMADQAITLETGATLNGRALARIAAINLDTNSIVKPLP